MTRQSLAAFKQTVLVSWPAARARAAGPRLAQIAREGHARILAEQRARAGVTPDWTAFANRPGQTNLDQVRPPGPIVYRYDYRREIVKVALEALRQASPVVSGAYRDAHTVYVDGVPQAGVPLRLRPEQEIMIANPLPYARRIEIGKTHSGRDFVLQVPNRIYERTAKRTLAPRYRNAARITFAYVDPPERFVLRGRATANTAGGRRRRRRRAGETVRVPAIIIERLI